MEKMIRISSILALAFGWITIISWLIGVLWHMPNEGIVHNICRYSALITVVIGSVWSFMFMYKETK